MEHVQAVPKILSLAPGAKPWQREPQRREPRQGGRLMDLTIGGVLLALVAVGLAGGSGIRAARRHCMLGEHHFNKQEYAEAVEEFSVSLAHHPQCVDAYFNRGAAYIHLGHFQEAVDDLDRALELAPRSPKVLFNRCIAFMKLMQLDRALTDIDHALIRDPHFARAYLARALIQDQLGNQQRAQEEYARAVQLEAALRRQ